MKMNYVSGGADKISVEYEAHEQVLVVGGEFTFNGFTYIVKFKQTSKFVNKEVVVVRRKRS